MAAFLLVGAYEVGSGACLSPDDSAPALKDKPLLAAWHSGDILVLEIGSNGGWNNDYDVLIAQCRTMLEHAGCERFIILGDTDDPGTSIGDLSQRPFDQGEGPGETNWEAVLREEFGEHFVNMRVFLIEQGLQVAGLQPNEDDLELALAGCVSPQLRADTTHLNAYGYYAKAQAVY